MALLILALLQRIFLMSSLMLLLVWLIFFMVLIKLLPILGTISGKTVKLMVLALICLGNNRQDRPHPDGIVSCRDTVEAVQKCALRAWLVARPFQLVYGALMFENVPLMLAVFLVPI